MRDPAANDNNVKPLDVERPFPGLRSYDEKEKLQFGGRDMEVRELFNLVENNRLTIVFGKSGIGKTSLINAGLVPALQKNYYFIIYIRIDYNSTKSPLSQLKDLIYESLKNSDKNISEIGDRTLWEYFHEVRIHQGLLTPVLIFDQFEETFTIGKDKIDEVHEFIVELSDLAENRVPFAVQQKYQNNPDPPTLIYSDQSYHVVLSLREDYLAQLESIKRYLPSLKNSRSRIVQMTVFQALDAVMKPAGDLIDKDVALEIIKKLPGISGTELDISDPDHESAKRSIVEPFLLGLICYEINERRIEKGLDRIDAGLVSQFDISDVINSYYDKTMAGFNEKVRQGIEDSLLTENDFRKLQYLEELEAKYNIKDRDIQQLIEKRIIRKELRDGVEYVELIHDILIPVIKARRDTRAQENREREKTEAIKNAIQLYKANRKRKIITALSIVLPVLLIFGYKYKESLLEQNRLENIAFARKLLFTARRIAGTEGDKTAALISRVAFKINQNNGGDQDIAFYNSMYESLVNLDMQFFEFAHYDSMQVKAIVNSDGDTYYLGFEDGKVFRKNLTDSLELFYDFKHKITGMAISNDKRYLAVSGIFDSVAVFDLLNFLLPPISLPGDNSRTGKSVCFTEDGRLLLRLTSKILAWNISSWSPVLWAERIQIEAENTTNRIVTKEISRKAQYFEYGRGQKIYCMTVSKNNIALGTDSAVILILKDSVIKINSKDLGNCTAIAFDPSGAYLFIGNSEGTLCRMSMDHLRVEFDQYQTSRILSIACSGDGKYMASASWDGTIAIWFTQKKWNDSEPLLLSRTYESNIPFCVTFTPNNASVLAGYKSGHIFKWPVNIESLADSICKNVDINLDSTIWEKYIRQNIPLRDINSYTCIRK